MTEWFFLPNEVFPTWYISIKREQIRRNFFERTLIFQKNDWKIREQ